MRKFPLAISMLLLLSGCGGGGDDSNSTSSPSTSSTTNSCEVLGLKIANGESCLVPSGSDTPLVGLIITFANGSVGTCTGAVIAPTKILTAAHCLLDTVTRATVVTTAGVYDLVAASVPEDFGAFQGALGPVFANDVAVGVTAVPIPIQPLPLLRSRAPQIGELAVIAGIGEIAPNESPELIQAGNAVVQNVTSNHIFLVYEGDQAHPCRGDSGGPLLVFVNGQPSIAGVVSQSDPQVSEDGICEPGDVTLYTNLQSSSAINFLSKTAGEASGS